MIQDGVYTPLSLDIAVWRSALILKKFKEAKINVIRIGLCASENLSNEDTYFSGPNHSALGELVENELYYIILKQKLKNINIIAPILNHISVNVVVISSAIANKIAIINHTNFIFSLLIKYIRFINLYFPSYLFMLNLI